MSIFGHVQPLIVFEKLHMKLSEREFYYLAELLIHLRSLAINEGSQVQV